MAPPWCGRVASSPESARTVSPGLQLGPVVALAAQDLEAEDARVELDRRSMLHTW